MFIDMNTEINQEKWILAGVAAFLSLKFD